MPKLGVALPTSSCAVQLVAFPLALPMGWAEPPPFFTALAKMACDLANQQLHTDDAQPRQTHRLEAVAATPPTDFEVSHRVATTFRAPNSEQTIGQRTPMAAVNVYVDDFLLLAQTKCRQQRVMRAALQFTDDIYPVAHNRPRPS